MQVVRKATAKEGLMTRKITRDLGNDRIYLNRATRQSDRHNSQEQLFGLQPSSGIHSALRDIPRRVSIEPIGQGEERGSPKAHENPESFAVGQVRLLGKEPNRDGRDDRNETCYETNGAENPPVGC
jgi:hypothetical protein